MTNPISGPPAVDTNPLSFINILNQTFGNAASKNQTGQKNVNPNGLIDTWGLGDYSGASIPAGVDDLNQSHNQDADPSERRLHKSLLYTTTDEIVSQFNKMAEQDPASFVSIQQALYGSGKYGDAATPKSVGFGKWNTATKDALIKAVKEYTDSYNNNATLDTFNEWLGKQYATSKNDPYSPVNAGSTGSGSSAKQFNPSSPALISQQADAESQQLLGHSLDQSQTNQIVGQVQGEEQNAFNNGDVYLRGVTPQSAARTFIVDNNLPEYAQHQVEGYMNAFANMFLSGASQRANTGVGDVAISGGS